MTLQPFLQASPVIQAHVAAALACDAAAGGTG
jgi:uncharacterized membrane protein